MKHDPILDSLLNLSPADRLSIIEALWDSLSSDPGSVPMPDWHRELLDQRLADDDAAASTAESWPEIRRRIEAGR